MATLQDLMGAGIPAGLLDPQQQQALEQRARNQGLLNLGFAVLQASQGQPGQGRPGLGQIVAQAGPAFGQAYQGAFDKTLTDILRAQQIQDMQRKRQQQERFRQALEGARTTRVSPTLGLGAEQVASPITQAEIEAFGPDAYMGAARTVAPTETVIDRNRMLSAIAEVDPTKYLELTKEPEAPSEIRTLQTLLSNPKLLEGYLQIQQAKAPSTSVTLSQADIDQEILKKVDAPLLAGFTTAATSSGEFARTAEQINRLLKGKGGGELVKIGTGLAATLGLDSDQIAAQDLANSLVVQLAPRMRAPGSGSTSDIEFKSYISAVPSLSNSERGREIMTKYATAFAERNAKLADKARELTKKGQLTFQAMRDYDNSLGPLLGKDFYESVQGPQPKVTPGGALDFRSGQGGPF